MMTRKISKEFCYPPLTKNLGKKLILYTLLIFYSVLLIKNNFSGIDDIGTTRSNL